MSIDITPDDIIAIAPEFATFLATIVEVQGITFSAVPDAGTFKLAYKEVESTVINFDDDDSDIQTALRTIAGLEEVSVLGDFTDGFTVTFDGVDGNLPLLVSTDSDLTIGMTPAPVEIEIGVITNGHFPEDVAGIIELAREFVCESRWGSDAKAKNAICLMTAHLMKELGIGAAVYNSGVSGPITAERVGDLSRTYGQFASVGMSMSERLLATTKYGKTFLMLRNTLVTTPFVV